MVLYKKTKVGFVVIIILFVVIIFFSQYQKVEIMYFTNPKCLVAQTTDEIIDGIKEEFGDKVHVLEFRVNMYPNDAPDTEDVRQLRDKYQVYGVPDIILNGQKFTKKYTKDNLEQEICNKFLIKPGLCWFDEK